MPDRLRMTTPDLMGNDDLAAWLGAIAEELSRREPEVLDEAVKVPSRVALEALVSAADQHLSARDPNE